MLEVWTVSTGRKAINAAFNNKFRANYVSCAYFMEKTCFWLCSINETVGYELNEGAVRQCRVGAGVGCARDVDAHEALTGHVQQ